MSLSLWKIDAAYDAVDARRTQIVERAVVASATMKGTRPWRSFTSTTAHLYAVMAEAVLTDNTKANTADKVKIAADLLQSVDRQLAALDQANLAIDRENAKIESAIKEADRIDENTERRTWWWLGIGGVSLITCLLGFWMWFEQQRVIDAKLDIEVELLKIQLGEATKHTPITAAASPASPTPPAASPAVPDTPPHDDDHPGATRHASDATPSPREP